MSRPKPNQIKITKNCRRRRTEKKNLTAEQEAELTQLWKKLVKLYHPDRFADEPDKLATYHKLTAAINHAKDNGDIETLREIAEDPEGFLFGKSWAKLDFSDKKRDSRNCGVCMKC